MSFNPIPSSSYQIIFSLLTLTFLEIVLGIDNLVFLTVASSKLPIHKQKMARRFGLLFCISHSTFFTCRYFLVSRLESANFYLLKNIIFTT